MVRFLLDPMVKGGIRVSQKEERLPYASVWGDTVKLEHLAVSTVLGVVLTMAFYSFGLSFFSRNPGIKPDLAKGYAMMVGVVGCIISCVTAAILFKPKRVIVEKAEHAELPEILNAAGMTLEEERQALESIDAQTATELSELGLKDFLSGNVRG
ncbi:MAG TPA: hypothetical protein GXX40_08015 [Firmicutes bacterium]|nr:hypothetical protein [Bacillota bacterium]